MKRWITATAAVLLGCFCLTGCGTKQQAEPVTTGFSCRLTAAYNGLSLEGDMTRRADGSVSLNISQPKSLSGVGIGFDGTDFTMEMAGMHIKLPPEKVPSGALIRSLLQILDAPASDGEITDEGRVITGTVEEKAYTAVFDPETGLPRSVSVPEDDLSATFTDVKRLAEE